jgi:hypothetical protein
MRQLENLKNGMKKLQSMLFIHEELRRQHILIEH